MKKGRLRKLVKVEQYIQERIKNEGCIHMTLLDPEKKSGYDCASIAKAAESGGTTAIMVGGSTVASGVEMEDAVKRIKAVVKLPVIIFPNNLTSLTGAADAIWFMSLLNSGNTYYLMDSQALGAPTVKKLGLEVMPMGYIIIGYGGAAYAAGIKHAKVKKDSNSPAILPTAENIGKGEYPITRFLYMYLRSRPTGETKKYIDWILSQEGQMIVTEVGYFPYK